MQMGDYGMSAGDKAGSGWIPENDVVVQLHSEDVRIVRLALREYMKFVVMEAKGKGRRGRLDVDAVLEVQEAFRGRIRTVTIDKSCW